MKRFVQAITQNPYVRKVKSFYKGAESDLASVAVAYYLLIAIFPLFLLLGTLLPYLVVDVQDVLHFLKEYLPAEIYDSIGQLVLKILSHPSTGWVGLSILTALWTFSQSMVVLQKAFDKAYGIAEHRDMFIGRLIGMVVGLLLQVGLFLLGLLGFLGQYLVSLLEAYTDLELEMLANLVALGQPVVYLGFFLVLILLYWLLPNVRIAKMRYVLPGTIFVLLSLLGTTKLVSFYLGQYLTKFEHFQATSFVLVLVVMVWFILIARVLIIGAILNASYQGLVEASFIPRRGTVKTVMEKVKMVKQQTQEGAFGTKGLLVMDVDSTLIMEEAIDILGDLAGVGPEVAVITERAMQGELDFEEALKERVALLKGLPETIFDLVMTRIHLTKGAKELVDALHARGYKVGLVSGGFHENVDPLARELGIDYVKANRLETKNGALTGRTIGEIVTKTTKVAMLKQWAKENGLELSQTIAMGDGANDLPMIETAGIGIAFNAKPIVRKLAPFQINEYDLYKVIEILEMSKNEH